MSWAEIVKLGLQVALAVIQDALTERRLGREKDTAYRLELEHFNAIAAAATKRVVDQARQESKTAQVLEEQVDQAGDPEAWRSSPKEGP